MILGAVGAIRVIAALAAATIRVGPPATYAFVCTVPGNAERGMHSERIVTQTDA